MTFTPSLSLLIFSVVIVFLMNVPYRFLVNQQEAGAIKTKVKELQERSKYVQRQGNAMLASQLMRESLAEHSKLTRLTMKPMLVSLVVAIIILPLFSNIYGDVTIPIKDGKGEAKVNGNQYTAEVTGTTAKISSTDSRTVLAECAVPCRKSFGNELWNIAIENNNVVLQRIVALLPVSLPVISDSVGWLGWYFLVSIPLMILSRKMLKINI